jgi:nucleoside-diphosphate-sugar epimerase
METVLVSGGSGHLGQLGKRAELSNAKARALGWEPRPVEEPIVDCGRSLAE